MTDSDDAKSRKRRFYGKKAFWLACLSVIVAICVRYAVLKRNDKPLTIPPVDSVDAEPDYAHGVGVDFRRRFELRQEASLLPADENGWKLILQALGPLALEQEYLATRTPWDQLSTERWFNDYWTPVCEKFGIDPNAPPTFLTRLDLYRYLIKNGITGEEPEFSDSESAEGIRNDRELYWEDYEEKIGRLSSQQVIEGYQRLLDKPWTKDDCPVAARWIEENTDLYDVLSKAVRSPRFACWHIVPDYQCGWLGMLLPDVQFSREFARKFKIRANYRIGTGDFSGAIDDVESTVLLAKSFFVNREDKTLVSALVGVAIMGIAADVKLDGGASGVEPTTEDYARLNDVWNDYFGKLDFKEATRNALKGERDILFLPTSQEMPELLRNGSLKKCLHQLSSDSDDSKENGFSILDRILLFRGSFNDGVYMAEMERLWNELIVDKKVDIREWRSSYRPKSREENLAKSLFLLLGPATEAFGQADERADCVVNMKLLTIALLRYQAEHGTLPPAFIVDAEGTPLQSWRVLILPYLGEDNKALYEQIRLDEPWDSDYNKQFHARSPKVFQCLSNKKRGEGLTTYSVILGDDALFDASGVGKDLRALRKREGVETNSQALIVERDQPICWMKPDEELNAQSFRENVAALDKDPDCGHSGGINVGRADGSVSFFATYGAEDCVFDRYVSGVRLPDDAEDDK